MANRFTWVTVDHPGQPDYAVMRDEHLIDSAIYRDQMRALGQEVGPDLPGVNVPDDYDQANRAEPAAVPARPEPVAVPPVALCLSREQAAEALSVGVDWFDAHVKPNVRVIMKGRRVLVPVAELEKWVNSAAAKALR